MSKSLTYLSYRNLCVSAISRSRLETKDLNQLVTSTKRKKHPEPQSKMAMDNPQLDDFSQRESFISI
jgi:hypothetical protein